MLNLQAKGSRYSATLHLSFRVEKQDDDEWPWVVTLVKVEPRGTGLVPDITIPKDATVDCGHCDANGPQPGRRICDACAVEEWVACIGAEDWLERAHVKIGDQEGMLNVHGHVEWPVTEESEETFWPSYLRWDNSPLHCLIEAEDESWTGPDDVKRETHWDPGWYFYDETWASRHGPFSTYEETAKAWKHYTDGL
jgi:hypothetical protein